MKAKLLLAGMLMLSIFTLHAQTSIPKGSVLLGGDLNFYSNKYQYPFNNTETKTTGFGINPSLSIAVKDNLFLGIMLGVGFSKNSSNGPSSPYDSIKGHSYNASFFVRKYKPLRSNFYLFLQGGLGGSYGKRSIEDVANRDFYQKDLGVNLSISPGLSYAINSKLQIETGFNNIVGIGYSRSELVDNNSFSGKRTNSSFNAYANLNNFNSQLYIGFRLLLQKKDKANASSKQG